MKRTYIAPQTDIEMLHLNKSIMQDLEYIQYSYFTEEASTNVVTTEFEEESSASAGGNLWDE